jgi:pimeloyl-ACP methyl ester carboxylesterase
MSKTTLQPVAGQLFTYGNDPSRQLSVFMTGSQQRAVVVVGGVVDTFFALHSMRLLVKELEACGWSAVQPQLASSHTGFGARTHVGDAEDLQDLMLLLEKELQMNEITLFAWSSGVQVALEYLGAAEDTDIVTRVILQGVVTDPKDEVFSEETAEKRKALVDEYMSSGRRDSIVPESLYDIPLTAARHSTGGLPSLQEAVWNPAVAGNVEQLKQNLGNITVPVMFMIATGTEYMPTKEQVDAVKMTIAACAATPEIEVNVFEAAGDERRRMLRGSEAEHSTAITFFLKECDRRRDEREEAARQHAAEEMRRSRSILAKSLLKGS